MEIEHAPDHQLLKKNQDIDCNLYHDAVLTSTSLSDLSIAKHNIRALIYAYLQHIVEYAIFVQVSAQATKLTSQNYTTSS